MATAIFNKDETKDILRQYEQYIAVFRRDNQNSCPIRSKSLFKLWNTLFINSLLNTELNSGFGDGFSSSDNASSKQSVAIKKNFPVLNNLPEKLNQPSFLNSVNGKMDEFVSNNKRYIQPTNHKSNEKLGKPYRVGSNQDSTVITNYSEDTIVEFSCGKIKDFLDMNKDISVNTSEYSNSIIESQSSFDHKPWSKFYRHHQFPTLRNKYLPSKRKTVRQMRNEIFFISPNCSQYASMNEAVGSSQETSSQAEDSISSSFAPTTSSFKRYIKQFFLKGSYKFKNEPLTYYCSRVTKRRLTESLSCPSFNAGNSGNQLFSPSVNSLPFLGNKKKSNQAALHNSHIEKSHSQKIKASLKKVKISKANLNNPKSKNVIKKCSSKNNYSNQADNFVVLKKNPANSSWKKGALKQWCISQSNSISLKPTNYSFPAFNSRDKFKLNNVTGSGTSKSSKAKQQRLKVLYENSSYESKHSSAYARVPSDLEKHRNVTDEGNIGRTQKDKIIKRKVLPSASNQLSENQQQYNVVYENSSCDSKDLIAYGRVASDLEKHRNVTNEGKIARTQKDKIIRRKQLPTASNQLNENQQQYCVVYGNSSCESKDSSAYERVGTDLEKHRNAPNEGNISRSQRDMIMKRKQLQSASKQLSENQQQYSVYENSSCESKDSCIIESGPSDLEKYSTTNEVNISRSQMDNIIKRKQLQGATKKLDEKHQQFKVLYENSSFESKDSCIIESGPSDLEKCSTTNEANISRSQMDKIHKRKQQPSLSKQLDESKRQYTVFYKNTDESSERSLLDKVATDLKTRGDVDESTMDCLQKNRIINKKPYKSTSTQLEESQQQFIGLHKRGTKQSQGDFFVNVSSDLKKFTILKEGSATQKTKINQRNQLSCVSEDLSGSQQPYGDYENRSKKSEDSLFVNVPLDLKKWDVFNESTSTCAPQKDQINKRNQLSCVSEVLDEKQQYDTYENVTEQSEDSLFVNVPLDLKKCGLDNEDSFTQKNKVIKGIPVFPVHKTFRTFAHFNSSTPLKEDVFEDYTTASNREKSVTAIEKVERKENEESVASLCDIVERVDVDMNTDQTRTVRTRKYCQRYNSFNPKVQGKETVFETVVDMDESKTSQSVVKQCPDKLHEELLNNIYRSVSIKIKKYKNKFETIQRKESLMPEFESKNSFTTDTGSELMLSFAIENIENEYLKKSDTDSNLKICPKNSKTPEPETELAEPTPPALLEPREPCVVVRLDEVEKNKFKFHNISNTFIDSNFSESKMNELSEESATTNGLLDYSAEQSLLNTEKAGCWDNDNISNDQDIKLALPFNVNLATTKKFSKFQMDSFDNLDCLKKKNSNFEEDELKTISQSVQVGYANNRTNPHLHNINFKFNDGTYLLYKTKEESSDYSSIPKKSSFWATMLKQTARLVPFFTFHGTKINLEALGDSLNREK